MSDAFPTDDGEPGASALGAARRAKDVALERARRAFVQAKATLAQVDDQVADIRARRERQTAEHSRELSAVPPRSGDDLARWDAYRRRCALDADRLGERLRGALERREAAQDAVDAAGRELAGARADAEAVGRAAADRAERARRRARDRADDERDDEHLARWHRAERR